MEQLDLDQAIVELVSRGAVKVPPYPAVAFRIEALLRTSDYGIDEIAKLVSSDQVLAADVLRCANSAIYARGAPSASVKQAVSRVGAKDVARLALASGLGAHAAAPGRLAALRRRAWLEALTAAILCQALAPNRRIVPDVAFAAGLLHDFGRVLTIACLEDIIGKKKGNPRIEERPERVWTEVIDRYHVELGIVMAARWDLPQLLADVISLHHGDASSGEDPALVECVEATDEIVALLGDRVALPEEDLGLASLVSSNEYGAVVTALHGLPAFVASFDTPEAWKNGGESIIQRPAPPDESETGTKGTEVVLALGGKEYTYRILGVASTHLMVTGQMPLPENMLFSMKVRCEPPLEGFACVKLAWQEKGAHSLLVKPFALAGDALRRWKALVTESGKAT